MVMVAALLTTVLPDSAAAARYRRVRVKLTSSSKIAWGKFYINGRYKGRIYRSRYRTFRLRTRRRYRMRVRRTWAGNRWYRYKSVYLGRYGGRKTVFFHPKKRYGSSRYRNVRFKMTSSSQVRWAKLYINGRYRGRVYRNRYKRVRLRTGRRYRVVAKRTYRGDRYRRSKRIRVRSGSGSQREFLHVRRRGGSRRYTKVRLKLTSSSKIAWGKLYINGRYRGRVRRSRYKTLRLRSGRTYRMQIRRRWNGKRWRRTKRVRIRRGDRRKTVFFYPRARGGFKRYTRVRFKLTSSSKIAWGRLYVNGRYRGRVRRSRYKTLRLRNGRTYRIRVRRRWNGKRWYRYKRIRLRRGQSRKTVFLHPSAR